MSSFEKKEQNLNQLIDKLNSLSLSYSQPTYELEKLRIEKNELANQKAEIEKKNEELMREHKYLKNKIENLKKDLKKKINLENEFNKEIEEISQETQNLYEEVDKWRT